MATASDLKSWFKSLTLADITGFATDGREEDLHLDFKLVNDPDLKNRDDRRNFAKAVSGFANSDGGLIVWGVDCRKNSDGVDCASSAPGVENPSRFHSRLTEFTASAANPSVSGVEHRSLPDSNGADHGFAVTYVPASDGGPHMAKMGEDRYYRRSGASFLKMEHFEIADMFGRRPHPKLDLIYEVAKPTIFGRNIKLSIYLILENRGRGSARAAYLAIRAPRPFGVDSFGVDGNFNHGLRYRYDRRTDLHRFSGSSEELVHPSVSLTVTCLSASISPGERAADMAIEYEICAADIPLQKGTLVIPASELQPLQ